jgi:hypothetical protein
VRQVYDYSAKDFSVIAERNGENFSKANKSVELGREIVNTLFKFNMLDLYEGDVEIDKLSGELLTIMTSTTQTNKKNDLADALKYAVIDIPWDFESIRLDKEDPDKKMAPIKLTPEQFAEEQISLRRGEGSKFFKDESPTGWGDLGEDIDYWNEEYGS